MSLTTSVRTHLTACWLVSAALLVACAEPSQETQAPKASMDTPPEAKSASEHAVTQATLGKPSSLSAMEALLEEPGPIVAETIVSARWQSSRSGLINLEHDKAQNLSDGPEPIDIYFHALVHPEHGLYLIDTGAEEALKSENHPLKKSAVGQAFGFGELQVETSLASWREGKDPSGVFLTHLHLDHVLGLPDIARNVPIYVGPGEVTLESPFHALTQPAVDGLLEGRPPLRQWVWGDGAVIDVFGDASVFALSQPGHTPGSTAFVARTPGGAILYTGDVCHTAWGWNHDVEPGTFSHDRVANAESLSALRALAARHPKMTVRLGHQTL